MDVPRNAGQFRAKSGLPAATDAPGAIVSSTMRRFSPFVRNPRLDADA